MKGLGPATVLFVFGLQNKEWRNIERGGGEPMACVSLITESSKRFSSHDRLYFSRGYIKRYISSITNFPSGISREL